MRYRKQFTYAGVLLLIPILDLSLLADDTAEALPRPTPVTRGAMKQLLEEMKDRKPRIPLPEMTEEEAKADASAEPWSRGYEARLSKLFLPESAGARGYLSFSGSPKRDPRRPNPRFTMEEDPAVTLDYAFKTRLFWIASRANNCQYCLGHQESKLLAAGMVEDDIAALDCDWSAFPPAERAAFALARRLTLELNRLTDADLAAVREHFSELQVLEMALAVAGNNAINRWKEGIGVPQSTNGGNFGGGNAESPHSYLTETSERFSTLGSAVILTRPSRSAPVVPTKLERIPALSPEQLASGLRDAETRTARLTPVDDAGAREVFGELVPAGPVPGWMRLLAQFPIAGKRQLITMLAAENKLDIPPLLRAQISWTIAKQDRAWYALGDARRRLKALAQDDAKVAALDDQTGEISAADRALLTVATKLAASPVVLTDADVAQAVRLAGPRLVVQTIHYAAIRAQFDRFTEAAGLPLDK